MRHGIENMLESFNTIKLIVEMMSPLAVFRNLRALLMRLVERASASPDHFND
jgi:hypothetical protein